MGDETIAAVVASSGWSGDPAARVYRRRNILSVAMAPPGEVGEGREGYLREGFGESLDMPGRTLFRS